MESFVRLLSALVVLSIPVLAGCGSSRPVWHDQKLPSGRTIKVTSCLLVWGVEHDERDTSKDAFALEYVSADAQAEVARREAEAAEVFELIRPISEQWGFRSASIAGFPSVERKGRYDLYWFQRQSDGRWSFTRSERKVFATD
jgi:hypothetical protein